MFRGDSKIKEDRRKWFRYEEWMRSSPLVKATAAMMPKFAEIRQNSGFSPAFSDKVESDGRQMKQCKAMRSKRVQEKNRKVFCLGCHY